MRKSKVIASNHFRILTVDDDAIMTSTIQAYFQRNGYEVDAENDPYKAIESVRNGHYDIMLLDFLMSPICGNQVVEEIRKFNKDLYIILLTGHKSMAPPIKTIRELDIQGYYEKSDRFDQLELLVESCVKSINQIRQIRRYEGGLSKIMDFMPHVYKFKSLNEMAEGILKKIEDLVSAEQSFILFDKGDGDRISRTRGMNDIPEIAESVYEELSDRSCMQQGEFWIFPLWDVSREQVGLMGIKCPGGLDTAQMQILSVFIRQIAAALINRNLHFQLNEAYLGTISTLRYAVEAKDAETRGHSDRVSKMAALLSEYMEMDNEFICQIKVAGLFHDIGKIGISDKILLKPGRMTDEEFEEIKKHPDIGAKILSGLADFKELMPIVRSHHERIDGRGYPDELKGDQIPDGAKIISIVDSFDALVSNRTYRKGRSFGEALEEIRKNRGSQFDERFADCFIKMLTEEPEKVQKLYGAEGEN